ncbi:phosphinothricin acetyltransferase [Thermoflexales bacterium]|nr:phosphinothricin acetyltransferase [Thermoflexales bacterium]
MTNIVHIRVATPSDNALLAELGARTYFDTFARDNTPEDMADYLAASFGPQKQADELADPLTTFLIAEIDHAAAGYARLRLSPPPAAITGRHPLEIARFYSDKAWIGRGVGAALMSACLDCAARHSCDTIWLDVWERNARAIAFYQKWGFAVVGTQTFQMGRDLQNDLLMQRPVTR